MAKAALEEIVDLQKIGAQENPIKLNELLLKTTKNPLKPSAEDTEKVLLLLIDMQNDFMEQGSLPVPHSHTDVKNLLTWMYASIDKITDIAVSMDTHQPFQIFHPSWWVDEQGNHPEPFTVINKDDVENNKWKAAEYEPESLDYVRGLEATGKMKLVIWPYHCLQGTFGHSLENQLSNMIYYHSIARKSHVYRLLKGQRQLTEMYGIIKAEYDPKNKVNTDFLQHIEKYDKIVIAGEAKSHCVNESIKQLVEYFDKNNKDKLQNIYILEDCMSNIPGFEEETKRDFEQFATYYQLNIVNSEKFKL